METALSSPCAEQRDIVAYTALLPNGFQDEPPLCPSDEDSALVQRIRELPLQMVHVVGGRCRTLSGVTSKVADVPISDDRESGWHGLVAAERAGGPRPSLRIGPQKQSGEQDLVNPEGGDRLGAGCYVEEAQRELHAALQALMLCGRHLDSCEIGRQRPLLPKASVLQASMQAPTSTDAARRLSLARTGATEVAVFDAVAERSAHPPMATPAMRLTAASVVAADDGVSAISDFNEGIAGDSEGQLPAMPLGTTTVAAAIEMDELLAMFPVATVVERSALEATEEISLSMEFENEAQRLTHLGASGRWQHGIPPRARSKAPDKPLTDDREFGWCGTVAAERADGPRPQLRTGPGMRLGDSINAEMHDVLVSEGNVLDCAQDDLRVALQALVTCESEFSLFFDGQHLPEIDGTQRKVAGQLRRELQRLHEADEELIALPINMLNALQHELSAVLGKVNSELEARTNRTNSDGIEPQVHVMHTNNEAVGPPNGEILLRARVATR
eukprot:TRINITY_DN75103_c0_g1_i1.p1 TRINITY_DN75103_c0_g1~~TRINITY_DN75103_c0_g1_i1.p1  ORF type:complete len:501 (+),score=92.60 TRINITY_DN75103_c0_g1_i1:230-1732(+)